MRPRFFARLWQVDGELNVVARRIANRDAGRHKPGYVERAVRR